MSNRALKLSNRMSNRALKLSNSRLLSMEDNFRQKLTTTSSERGLETTLSHTAMLQLIEDDLQGKTPFDRGRLLRKDDLQWRTFFYGRDPLMEVKDNLQYKMTFEGRQSTMDEDLFREIF